MEAEALGVELYLPGVLMKWNRADQLNDVTGEIMSGCVTPIMTGNGVQTLQSLSHS